MEVLKVGIVIAAGLGSTWVARQATDAWLGPSAGRNLVQAQEPAPDGAPGPAAGGESPGAPATSSPPVVPEMTREEMEEELRRAQAELAGDAKGATGAELREFKPTRPLPADLPIALPSDI